MMGVRMTAYGVDDHCIQKRAWPRHVNGAATAFARMHQLVGTPILWPFSAALRVFSSTSGCSTTIPRSER